jgi:hypothetical protein
MYPNGLKKTAMAASYRKATFNDTPFGHGRKELVAVEDGYRESEASWFEALSDLRTRGLKRPRRVWLWAMARWASERH